MAVQIRRLSTGLLMLGLFQAAAVMSAFDPTKTPIAPVPPERYLGGDLEPGPILSDNSDFDITSTGSFDRPFYADALVVHDPASNRDYLFGAGGVGLGVWDVTNSASPIFQSYTRGFGNLPVWVNTDVGNILQMRNLDAPVNNSDLIGFAGNIQGFSIWNTQIKSAVSVHYQDEGVEAVDVYVPPTQLAGRYWAFVSHNGGGGGLLLYDMTAASSLNRCLDESPGIINCGNVYRGEIGSLFSSLSVSGADNYVATMYPGSLRKVRIWDVTNPLNPVEKLVESTFSGFTYALQMWSVPTEGGTQYYLAAQEDDDVAVYNVSCITGVGTCTLGSPTRFATPDLSSLGVQRTITVSDNQGTPYLYIGNDRDFGCAYQREYILDMSNPNAPVDITPDVSVAGFWEWYYNDCPTGFNFIKPWAGRVYKNVLYRAAHSGLDTFRLVSGATPIASFTFTPTSPNVGQQVCFTDTSIGGPTGWSWTFAGGTPSSSFSQNPCTTFSSSGPKNVTLIASNGAGNSAPSSQTVNVVNPEPQVASVTSNVSSALVCGQVTFTANGVAGQAPLTLAWEVRNTAGGLVTTGGNVNPFVWDIDPGQAPGGYDATVTVSNPTPSTAMATSPNVTVSALPSLAFTGPGGAPTADPFTGSTVQFDVQTQGATEWNWNFGDGMTTGWISDPIAGPRPQHTYTSSGMYNVTVMIRNCTAGPITSAALSVDVIVEPLNIVNFRAACPLNFCNFDTGDSISFTHIVEGAPQSYDYDWDGDGTYEEISQTEVDRHIYCQAGSFKPVLRIRNGLDSDLMADTNTSTLNINGTSACGLPNAPTNFSAVPGVASIQLNWTDASTNEDGFRVLRSLDNGATYLPIATLSPGANSYVDTSPVQGVLYTYSIQVFTDFGVNNSVNVQAQTTGVPPFFADGFESGNTSAWSDTIGTP